MINHIFWKNGALHLLDQRYLPFKKTYVRCRGLKEVASAIKDMVVRGAPLIGIVAAYGIALGVRELIASGKPVRDSDVERMCRRLGSTRPTAVNLFWALDRMRRSYDLYKNQADLGEVILQEAVSIHNEDIENNKTLSRFGSELIDDDDVILTHCNAGALATGGYGTALGVIRAAHESGKALHVIATETRPYLQGARLTAWELREEGISVELVPDNHVGLLCERGLVDKVIVGADRIARNGDTANKIGTYTAALAAHDNGVPFFVAAPLSTFDAGIRSGEEIEIEERDGKEVKYFRDVPVTLRDIRARYYGFDVTPARLIAYIITERGILEKPFGKYIKMLFSAKRAYNNDPH